VSAIRADSRKRFSANITQDGRIGTFAAGVDQGVCFEVSQLAEQFVANVATVRLLTKMCTLVLGEISGNAECLGTDVAYIRFIACVDAFVSV